MCRAEWLRLVGSVLTAGTHARLEQLVIRAQGRARQAALRPSEVLP